MTWGSSAPPPAGQSSRVQRQSDVDTIRLLTAESRDSPRLLGPGCTHGVLEMGAKTVAVLQAPRRRDNSEPWLQSYVLMSHKSQVWDEVFF
ncbi:unnamed protein product [Arctogadus glacialis]